MPFFNGDSGLSDLHRFRRFTGGMTVHFMSNERCLNIWKRLVCRWTGNTFQGLFGKHGLNMVETGSGTWNTGSECKYYNIPLLVGASWHHKQKLFCSSRRGRYQHYGGKEGQDPRAEESKTDHTVVNETVYLLNSQLSTCESWGQF